MADSVQHEPIGLAAPPLQARSVAEVHVYLDLLGWPPGRRGQRLVRDGDALLSEYRWDAAPDGVPRVIRVDVPPVALAEVGFGAAPSTMLDPAGWRLAGDRIAAAVPASPRGLTDAQRRGHRARLMRAAECLEQAAAFAGRGEEIPESAFFTATGRAAYSADPGRFRVDRLRAMADAWRAKAVRLWEATP